jgi:transcriptional regulator with XRE-family HTH domain
MTTTPATQRQIGLAIKVARVAKEMNQGQLATALGIGQSAVSRWEKGHAVPTWQMQARLATVLDVPHAELFGELYGQVPA